MAHSELITPVIVTEEILKNPAIKAEVVNRLVTTILEKEDRELADAIRALTWRALAEADTIMAYGPSNERMMLIKTVITNAARLIGATSSSNIEEGRVAFGDLMEGMREVPPRTSAPITATPPTTDDPD